jgi:hypothetical protein
MVKYLVIWLNTSHRKDDVDVIDEYGGVTSIHFNDEHYVSSYYQNRIDKQFLEKGSDLTIWEDLAQGKMYIKDWKGDTDDATEEMIHDAMNWLNPAEEISETYLMYDYQPNEDINPIIKQFLETQTIDNPKTQTFEI